jgi:hypothetical protein
MFLQSEGLESSSKGSSKLEEVLEPLFAFFAAEKPFAEVSRLAVVSTNWKTAEGPQDPQLHVLPSAVDESAAPSGQNR